MRRRFFWLTGSLRQFAREFSGSRSQFLVALRQGGDEASPTHVTEEPIMQTRMKVWIPEAIQALQSLGHMPGKGGVPAGTLALTHLRASQINGCSVCVDMALRFKKPEETVERLFAVAAWRDAPFFTEAERAALALAEAVTRLSDRTDPVPDDIWNEARKHYNEQALASLLLSIAITNVWNRLNVATRQVAGEWATSADAQKWAQQNAAPR
jgi:AhpD family alkylhydroperoxidase